MFFLASVKNSFICMRFRTLSHLTVTNLNNGRSEFRWNKLEHATSAHAKEEYPLTRTSQIALQVVRTSFGFHLM